MHMFLFFRITPKVLQPPVKILLIPVHTCAVTPMFQEEEILTSMDIVVLTRGNHQPGMKSQCYVHAVQCTNLKLSVRGLHGFVKCGRREPREGGSVVALEQSMMIATDNEAHIDSIGHEHTITGLDYVDSRQYIRLHSTDDSSF